MTDQSPPRNRLSVTRRLALALAASFGLGAAGLALSAALPGDAEAQRAASDKVPVDALMNAGLRPELVYGSPAAKITIVEYASMTCPHCAAFHNDIFPALKEKYIDTGKARLVFREFPLNNLSAGAAMLARCIGGKSTAKTLAVVGKLFQSQPKWAFVRSNPLPALFNIAKQFGFTEAEFNKCLKDRKLLDGIKASLAVARKEFGVNSTPHFFVNGKRMRAGSLKAFEGAIDPLLPK